MILIKNGYVFNENKVFEKKDLLVFNGIISQTDIDIKKENINSRTGNGEDIEVVNASNCYVVPGFIDIHTHGANGIDIMYADDDELNALSLYYASQGVTGFLATTMTAPVVETVKVLEKLDSAIKKGTSGARILGINLEGPFINKKYKGAHREELIIHPTSGLIEVFVKKSGENIRLITIAPELEGADSILGYFKERNITFAAGHSSMGYYSSLKSFNSGITHVTHLFNAMTGMHHREPGLAGAAVDNPDITVELIADGIHVFSSMIRMVMKCKTAGKVVLVTDSTMAAGLGDGEYSLGGRAIFVRDGEARLADGNLAGSTLTMINAVKNMVILFDVSLEDAVLSATLSPAKAINIDENKGSLKRGNDADVVILDMNLNVRMTIVEGRIVYSNL